MKYLKYILLGCLNLAAITFYLQSGNIRIDSAFAIVIGGEEGDDGVHAAVYFEESGTTEIDSYSTGYCGACSQYQEWAQWGIRCVGQGSLDCTPSSQKDICNITDCENSSCSDIVCEEDV